MRLILKTTTYGLTHLVVATTVAYAITGNFAMALGIGIIEPLVQTGIFALHDHLWERKAPHAQEGLAYMGTHDLTLRNDHRDA